MGRKPRNKVEMYRLLQAGLSEIYAAARKAADEIGIPREWRGKFGLTGAISGCPAPLRREVVEAGEKGAREVIPLKELVEEIRMIVKEVYGDDYDAAPINTCEAGLWVTYDALFTPPMQGRGDNYRARYIAPYERHLHHHGGYGRPFPPRYKDVFADRGCTAGELGFYGKRLENLDAVIVRLAGARYEVHGIKYHPAPLLLGVDAEAAATALGEAAELHARELVGFTSLGYDSPGYGYGAKDGEGTPVLLKKMGGIARRFGVPYVVDNAWGLPFIGVDIRKLGADMIIYSMDKASGAPTSGLIIGREECMVPVRRALGMHGDRWGTVGSYGKAAYVTADPGKEALLGQVAALRLLRDRPDSFTGSVEELCRIVREEFAAIHPRIKSGLSLAVSRNCGAVEVNYEKTWTAGALGFPIFPIEDMYAGSHVLQAGLAQMGIIPTIAYDANIFISPGQGTTDEDGALLEDRARLAVRGLVRLMEIVGRHVGYID